MVAMTVHVPVMMDDVLAALGPFSGKAVVDGTLGGGGHSAAMLRAGATSLTAFDWDAAAIERCAFLTLEYGERVRFVHAGYDQMLDVLGESYADAILMDLGLSSDQLDDPQRGLSYHGDGPLDMRLDSRVSRTAADVLNHLREEELADVFFHFGEEPRARVLARAIVKARKARPFVTTSDLMRVVEEVYPPRFGLKRAHPAARIFQALRVVVNDEMAVLERALHAAARVLAVGGKLAVITFQPLEERLVKKVFRELCADTLDDVGRVAVEAPFSSKGKVVPQQEEVENNPRARSAILRVLERLA